MEDFFESMRDNYEITDEELGTFDSQLDQIGEAAAGFFRSMAPTDPYVPPEFAGPGVELGKAAREAGFQESVESGVNALGEGVSSAIGEIAGDIGEGVSGFAGDIWDSLPEDVKTGLSGLGHAAQLGALTSLWSAANTMTGDPISTVAKPIDALLSIDTRTGI